MVARWMNSRRLSRPGGEGLDGVELQRRRPSGEPCPTGNSPSCLSPPARQHDGDEHRRHRSRAAPRGPATLPPAGPRCVGTVLAALPTVNEPASAATARYSGRAHHPDPTGPARRCRSTRRSRRPGTRSRAARSRPRSSASRPTRASSGIGSGDTMDGFEAFEHLFVGEDPLAIARHVRVLETIDFHAGRYWPLEAALWDIIGQVAGLPVATLFGGASEAIPAYASCGMLLPPAERAESALRLREEGFRALKIRIDPRRLEDGLAAVAATRDAVGDSMAIMVDLNQGWRMAGDTSRSLDPVAAREIAGRLADSACCGSRSRSPARTCGPGGAAGLGARDPHRRRRDDPDVRRAAGGDRGGRLRRPSARRRPGRRDAPRRGRSPSSRSPATAGSRRTPGRTGSACWPTCTSRPASVAGRSSSSRTTRPAGRRSGATSCSPSRSGPDADGVLRVPATPGLGVVLDEAAFERFAA